MIRQLLFFTFLCLGFYGLPAHSAEELLVRDSVPVYAQPDRNSPVITTLERGERVPISSVEYGRFRKVLVESGSKKKQGYVLKLAIESSRIREKRGGSEQERSVPKIYHRRYGLGVHVAMTNTKQASRKINTGDSGDIELEEMTGTTTWFGLHFDMPVSPSFAIRAEMIFRKFNDTGKARPTGGQYKEIERGVTMFGGALTAKYYFDANGDFWAGAGIELARATNVKLVYANNQDIKVNESDYPTYFAFRGGIGDDFGLFSDVVLTPELRFVAVTNASPMITGGEIVLNFSYAF